MRQHTSAHVSTRQHTSTCAQADAEREKNQPHLPNEASALTTAQQYAYLCTSKASKLSTCAQAYAEREKGQPHCRQNSKREQALAVGGCAEH